MKYRPEIDGLRAVAVVPVIFFHAGFGFTPGGFIGVDVFFVISGFLITTIIRDEIASGHFSLLAFYERRVRRIFPALFFVLLCSIPFAWYWMLPQQFKDFSQSFIAISLFAANIFFWLKSGYFETDADLKPTLHTWSLSVEEQFYFFFPLLLFLIQRRHLLIILLIALFSFSLAVFDPFMDPSARFFLIHTRAWELGLGALATSAIKYRVVDGRLRGILAFVGIALILVSVGGLSHRLAQSGLYPLPAVVGTVFIILFAGKENLAGRVLSWKPLVYTGLISYSAYLWHQPLFAFFRLRAQGDPSDIHKMLLCLATIGLSVLSYRYVEKPFRSRTAYRRRAVFVGYFAGTALLLSIGAAGALNAGFPERMTERTRHFLAFSDSKDPLTEACWNRFGGEFGIDRFCSLGEEGTEPRVALIGDSNAAVLTAPLDADLQEKGIGGLNMTYNSCLPFHDGGLSEKSETDLNCSRFRSWLFQNLDELPPSVIVMARWAFFMQGTRFDNGEGGIEPGKPLYWEIDGKTPGDPGYAGLFKENVHRLIATLLEGGKTVYLVYPVPEVGWVVPTKVAADEHFHGGTRGDLSTDYAAFKRRTAQVYEALDALADHPGLVRVIPENIFCNNEAEGRCAAQVGEELLYYDDDHLSLVGARLLADKIVSAGLLDRSQGSKE